MMESDLMVSGQKLLPLVERLVFVIELICGSCSTIGREVGVFTLHREFVWTEMSKCAPMGGVWCCFDFLETQKYIEMYAWAKEEKGRRPIWLGWLCPRTGIILSKHGHTFFLVLCIIICLSSLLNDHISKTWPT